MENLVFNVNGKAVTTSRKVAEVFEKQHKNVLRSIRELKIPEDFDRLNFQPSVYKIPNPSGGKPAESPEYLITRDGFTLLAMGFTGKKAMEFKLAYIEAFNEMEKTLNAFNGICNSEATVLPRKSVNIAASTAELINKINHQLIAGEEVQPEVLRYAWNIGRLVGGSQVRKSMAPDALTEFINNIAPGRYTRAEVYEMYCASCPHPQSPRWFWPRVRERRNCEDVRDSVRYYVVFK